MKWPLLIMGGLLLLAFGFVAYSTRHEAVVPSTTATSTTPTIFYNNATADDIVVTAPLAGATLGQQFTVSGKARGNWYFEASFPIEVDGADGTVLAQFPMQAQSNWMTTDFVPFTTVVDVGTYRGAATVILHKDNPSGMAEYDANISFPIMISGPASAAPATTTDSVPAAGSDGAE